MLQAALGERCIGLASRLFHSELFSAFSRLLSRTYLRTLVMWFKSSWASLALRSGGGCWRGACSAYEGGLAPSSDLLSESRLSLVFSIIPELVVCCYSDCVEGSRIYTSW